MCSMSIVHWSDKEFEFETVSVRLDRNQNPIYSIMTMSSKSIEKRVSSK